MVASGQNLDAQILKVGHHGSSTSSTAGFLAAVSPDVAIYSAGIDNSYGHPHREPIERLTQMGTDIYGTDEHGTVTVTTDGHTYEVSTTQSGNVPSAQGSPGEGNAPIQQPAAPQPPVEQPTAPQQPAVGCIDINTASFEALQGIIHIGPDRAQQIINLRPFNSVDGLTRVSGIASARIQDIKQQGLACV